MNNPDLPNELLQAFRKAVKEERRKRAIEFFNSLPPFPGLKNCGRVVLAGRCCDKPEFEKPDDNPSI